MALSFNAVPDFEVPADYERETTSTALPSRPTSRGTVTGVARLNVTVRVTNVDEPGKVEANVVEPRVGQTLRLERAGRGRRRVRQGSGSGKRAFPTAHAARWATRRSPTWETIPGASGSSYTPDGMRTRAIASGSRPSTTTGRARAGASSSSPPSQWRSGVLRPRRGNGQSSGKLIRGQQRRAVQGQALQQRRDAYLLPGRG